MTIRKKSLFRVKFYLILVVCFALAYFCIDIKPDIVALLMGITAGSGLWYIMLWLRCERCGYSYTQFCTDLQKGKITKGHPFFIPNKCPKCSVDCY